MIPHHSNHNLTEEKKELCKKQFCLFRRNSEMEVHSKAALFISDKKKTTVCVHDKRPWRTYIYTLQTLTHEEFLIPRIKPKKRWVKTTDTPLERRKSRHDSWTHDLSVTNWGQTYKLIFEEKVFVPFSCLPTLSSEESFLIQLCYSLTKR